MVWRLGLLGVWGLEVALGFGVCGVGVKFWVWGLEASFRVWAEV